MGIDIDRGFVAAVQAELERKRMGVTHLAAASAIPERTLRNILGGRQTVKLWQVFVISTALGLACSEIVSRAVRRARLLAG